MSSRDKARPCVLVYNPLSGRGHLDSWNAMFIALLLQKGWRVLALTPDPAALQERLAARSLDASPHLQILDWNSALKQRLRLGALLRPHLQVRAMLRPHWNRWVAFGDMHLRRLPGSEIRPEAGALEAFWGRTCQRFVPFLFRATHYVYRHYVQKPPPVDPPSAPPDPEPHLMRPVDVASRVKAALPGAKWAPALCLNMYIDTYRTLPEPWLDFEAVNSLPWAGLRFVPRAQPTEAWYATPSFRGMGLLDEQICDAYRSALPGRAFEYLPDITETRLAVVDHPLVQTIRQRAAGRRIAFLGGSIGGQKNLARWFEMAARAQPHEWFFVQAGEIHRGTLTPEDMIALDRVLTAPPENLLIHPEYLPDEGVFNAVIAASDVIFAVYRDFQISSNMLSKAAYFRKPIMVSNRYLLGERVTRYGIGRAVEEDDATSMLEALEEIGRGGQFEEGFARYRSDFSEDALAERLEALLLDCIEGTAR